MARALEGAREFIERGPTELRSEWAKCCRRFTKCCVLFIGVLYLRY